MKVRSAPATLETPLEERASRSRSFALPGHSGERRFEDLDEDGG